MQCHDMPVHAFKVFERERENIIHHEHLRNGRVRVTQTWTGQRSRDLHEAMDAEAEQVQQLGGREVFRTKIGRNATCPCGSGRKFKKCCIDRSKLVGVRR